MGKTGKQMAKASSVCFFKGKSSFDNDNWIKEGYMTSEREPYTISGRISRAESIDSFTILTSSIEATSLRVCWD